MNIYCFFLKTFNETEFYLLILEVFPHDHQLGLQF